MSDPFVSPELVQAARSGDVGALGALLAEHRPAMLAVALSFLPSPADAEDAVQDASLTALARIADLRDPQAAGPWLKMIVRNCCRMRLRATPVVPMADVPVAALPEPHVLLERHLARDWIWQALEQLSQPLRTVVLLRYFTSTTSYEQIAALCGIPVGTVRSRLSKARSLLAAQLRQAGEAAGPSPDRRLLARFGDVFADLTSARPAGAGLRGELAADLETFWDGGRRTVGLEPVLGLLGRSAQAGVRLRPVNLVASGDIVICETQTLNPQDKPDHCPPEVAWLIRLQGGRAGQLRLLHEPRTVAA